jgi:hypothetical protein
MLARLADEGSPDPLDLDGARPARVVSMTAPGGPRRALDLGVSQARGLGDAAGPDPRAPIRRSGSRGLVPLVELSRGRSGGHGGGTARRAGPERLGHPVGGEDVAHGERVLERGDHAQPPTIGLDK